jgi:peptidoglycan/LPS O-acetylase OafA/YrhL
MESGVGPGRVARPGTSAPYFPALDGIRAIAVLAVIAFHAQQGWAKGGFLGVEVFFVVSGFLITRLLVTEAENTGRVDVKGFWMRRARRLLPALFAMLGVVALWMLVLHPHEVGRFRRDFVAALTYVSNWFQIATDDSYFSRIGRASPLRHLWSLAVEEQFYLLWPPLLLVLALLAKGRRKRMAAMLTAMALASTAWMAFLYTPGGDPNRVYLATDTRLSGLLLGAAFGLVWRRNRIGRRLIRVAIAGASTLSLAALVSSFVVFTETSKWLYRGGFFAVDLATIAVIAASTLEGGPLRMFLSWAPLQAIGRRSYGLYLWHWPVLVLTDPVEGDVVFDGPGLWVMRAALTVALTEGCYRLVETPFRQGALSRWWHRVRHGGSQRRRALLPAASTVLASALLSFAVMAEPARPNDIVESINQGQAFLESLDKQPTTTTTTTTLPPTTTLPATTTTLPIDPAATTVATVPPVVETTTLPPPPPPPPPPVIAVGDSVMLGAAPSLVGHFGDRISIDARVSRGFNEGIAVLQAIKDAGTLTPVVIVHLGNNGPVTDKQFENLMAVLADVPDVVINTVRVDRAWQDAVNDTLRNGAARHPNVTVFDWFAASEGQSDLFYKDGTHLRPPGAEHYATLLQSLVDTITAPPPTTTTTTTTTTTLPPTTTTLAPTSSGLVPTDLTVPITESTTIAPPVDPNATTVAPAGP